MTTSDYVLNGALILLVVRQMHGRRLAGWSLYLPLAIVAYVASQYLRSIPTAGNDLAFVVGACVVGCTLGALCAVFTRVYPDHDGVPFAKAGGVAAALWVLGVGTRLVFELYATHGGGASILHFDAAHDITTIGAWTAALILMAIGEAVARTAVLAVRGLRMERPSSSQGAVSYPARVAVGAIMGDREA